MKNGSSGRKWRTEGEALLRGSGWLADIAEPLQGKLIAQGRWIERAAGEPLAMAGEEVGGLTGIAIGTVFSRAGNAPPDVSMTDLHFAPVWMASRALVPGEARMLSVVAQTEVKALRIPQFALFQLMGEHPELTAHLFRNFANLFARMTIVIGNAHLRDGRERCIAVLLRIVDDRYQGHAPDWIPIGQMDLAGMANVSRQKVGDVLRELEALGLVELGYRQMRVLDKDRLLALLPD